MAELKQGTVTMPLWQYERMMERTKELEAKLHTAVDNANELNDILAGIIDLIDKESENAAKDFTVFRGEIEVEKLCKIMNYELDEDKLRKIYEVNHHADV